MAPAVNVPLISAATGIVFLVALSLRLFTMAPPSSVHTGETDGCTASLSPEQRSDRAKQKAKAAFGDNFGSPVFLRLLKEDDLLELWLQSPQGTWDIAKQYPIAAWSGTLGPKLREGDGQSPEGFYEITLTSLNPRSNYHLSFNIGYPNAYDRALGRTGSFIMIHGSDVSIGCYAMTDPLIEEIYGMVEAALRQGQSCIPVQIYPFAMTPERMAREAGSKHLGHWNYLLPGWQYTETHRAPYPAQTLP